MTKKSKVPNPSKHITDEYFPKNESVEKIDNSPVLISVGKKFVKDSYETVACKVCDKSFMTKKK